MKRNRTVALLALVATMGAVHAQSDNCSTAVSLSGPGPFGVSTVGLTTGAQGQAESICLFFGTTTIASDGWFNWTATATGVATVSLCTGASCSPSGGTVDTKIAAYAGAGCPSAAAIACNDDTCGLLSQMSFVTTAGSTYALQVGSFPGGCDYNGSITISYSCPRPSNDTCSNAAALTVGSTTTADTTCAMDSDETTLPSTSCPGMHADVWYRMDSAAPGTYEFSVCDPGSSASNVELRLYPVSSSGSCPTTSTPSPSCSQACGGTGGASASLCVSLATTTSLVLRVGHVGSSFQTGTMQLTVSATCPLSPFTKFCRGDGSALILNCPCGNNGGFPNGCPNSFFPSGAALDATGNPSVSADTIVLQASQVTGISLFYQGPVQVPAFVVDDGINCVGPPIIRLGTSPSIANVAVYPQGAQLPVSVRGAIPPAGGTFFYQCWYRNAAAFCTPATSNRTNGLRIVWTP